MYAYITVHAAALLRTGAVLDLLECTSGAFAPISGNGLTAVGQLFLLGGLRLSLENPSDAPNQKGLHSEEQQQHISKARQISTGSERTGQTTCIYRP
jgi:hypothetical protein